MLMKGVTIIFGLILTLFLIPANVDVMELSRKLKIDEEDDEKDDKNL